MKVNMYRYNILMILEKSPLMSIKVPNWVRVLILYTIKLSLIGSYITLVLVGLLDELRYLLLFQS